MSSSNNFAQYFDAPAPITMPHWYPPPSEAEGISGLPNPADRGHHPSFAGHYNLDAGHIPGPAGAATGGPPLVAGHHVYHTAIATAHGAPRHVSNGPAYVDYGTASPSGQLPTNTGHVDFGYAGGHPTSYPDGLVRSYPAGHADFTATTPGAKRALVALGAQPTGPGGTLPLHPPPRATPALVLALAPRRNWYRSPITNPRINSTIQTMKKKHG
ncbi:hypothetical protein PtB15_7B526 [Puccinia triticina]|nr:hypothetical protein PtB15_7B526 [Puccinia triticina]